MISLPIFYQCPRGVAVSQRIPDCSRRDEGPPVVMNDIGSVYGVGPSSYRKLSVSGGFTPRSGVSDAHHASSSAAYAASQGDAQSYSALVMRATQRYATRQIVAVLTRILALHDASSFCSVVTWCVVVWCPVIFASKARQLRHSHHHSPRACDVETAWYSKNHTGLSEHTAVICLDTFSEEMAHRHRSTMLM